MTAAVEMPSGTADHLVSTVYHFKDRVTAGTYNVSWAAMIIADKVLNALCSSYLVE